MTREPLIYLQRVNGCVMPLAVLAPALPLLTRILFASKDPGVWAWGGVVGVHRGTGELASYSGTEHVRMSAGHTVFDAWFWF